MRDRAPLEMTARMKLQKSSVSRFKNDISVIKTPAVGIPDARGIIKCNCYTGEREGGRRDNARTCVSGIKIFIEHKGHMPSVASLSSGFVSHALCKRGFHRLGIQQIFESYHEYRRSMRGKTRKVSCSVYLLTNVSETLFYRKMLLFRLVLCSFDINSLKKYRRNTREKQKRNKAQNLPAEHHKLLTSRDFVAIYKFKIVPLCTLYKLRPSSYHEARSDTE